MSTHPKSLLSLADLIESHYGRPSDDRNGTRPRIRLRDWKLLEEISVGSGHYLLLCRVRHPQNGLESLSARERDAVRLASAGASNKEIAHHLGIHASTVRVFLSRASRKVGAAGRSALIEHFSIRQDD
jgi:DNA-binding CsgD family transcriptional regulator